MYKERMHIKGIVIELMNNALKADATDVNISIRKLTDEVEIRVVDNGKGMTHEQNLVVKRKLEQPRRDELEDYYGALAGESMIGTGLGLVGMITDRAEVHTALGEGTTIAVYRRM
ncbi:MAG: ATP-binding protein [Firmicutes bacterium]|nr:ATP-binding protein [Bacillota bacterium]